MKINNLYLFKYNPISYKIGELNNKNFKKYWNVTISWTWTFKAFTRKVSSTSTNYWQRKTKESAKLTIFLACPKIIKRTISITRGSRTKISLFNCAFKLTVKDILWHISWESDCWYDIRIRCCHTRKQFFKEFISQTNRTCERNSEANGIFEAVGSQWKLNQI